MVMLMMMMVCQRGYRMGRQHIGLKVMVLKSIKHSRVGWYYHKLMTLMMMMPFCQCFEK